ncbi:hypothetical protein [Paenibacillus thalictri]|nr:hypothetical protein [Paenibacillus thalictri]
MDPYKKLVSMLDLRMDQKSSLSISGLPCELGTITATGVKLDSFQHEIQQFYVSEWLAKLYFPSFALQGNVTGLKDSRNGEVAGECTFHFHEAAVNEVRISLKSGLQPGDRVLAVPVFNGQEVIVVSKVVSYA